MKNSKNSVLKLGKRRPYEPITRLTELPPAILEMATLLEMAKSGDSGSLDKAIALQESIIQFMLDNPACVGEIKNLLSNGYAIEFSVEKRTSDDSESVDRQYASV